MPQSVKEGWSAARYKNCEAGVEELSRLSQRIQPELNDEPEAEAPVALPPLPLPAHWQFRL
jgi:hypothetical protein